MRPELKQFADLRTEDFGHYPVWSGVHTLDYDEDWYDDEDVDEETFRPYGGPLPVSPVDGIFLIAATAQLADGSTVPGFITPAEQDEQGTLQPHITASDSPPAGFWGGAVGISDAHRERTQDLLGKTETAIFPIRFDALTGLATGVTNAIVTGWSGSAQSPFATVRPGLIRRLFARH
jgi:hypothetical protein